MGRNNTLNQKGELRDSLIKNSIYRLELNLIYTRLRELTSLRLGRCELNFFSRLLADPTDFYGIHSLGLMNADANRIRNLFYPQ